MFDVTIMTVPGVLDKIHDQIDGQDISGTELISDKIQDLMMAGLTKPFNVYLCYSCPALIKTKKDLESHVQTNRHLNLENLRKLAKKFRCEICEKALKDYPSLHVHLYSKEHIINARHPNAGHIKPEVQIPAYRPENFCYVCQDSDTEFEYHCYRNELHKNQAKVLDM